MDHAVLLLAASHYSFLKRLHFIKCPGARMLFPIHFCLADYPLMGLMLHPAKNSSLMAPCLNMALSHSEVLGSPVIVRKHPVLSAVQTKKVKPREIRYLYSSLQAQSDGFPTAKLSGQHRAQVCRETGARLALNPLACRYHCLNAALLRCNSHTLHSLILSVGLGDFFFFFFTTFTQLCRHYHNPI